VSIDQGKETGGVLAKSAAPDRLEGGGDNPASIRQGKTDRLRADIEAHQPGPLAAPRAVQPGWSGSCHIQQEPAPKHQWLNFVTSELHKLVFSPLLNPAAPQGAKDFAREKAEARFVYLNDRLAGRDYLLDRFTVADAYLVTVLNWAKYAAIDLARWPAVQAYFMRLQERPSVVRALAEERALYAAERARQAA